MLAKRPEPLFICYRKMVMANVRRVANNQIESVILVRRRLRSGEIVKMKHYTRPVPKMLRRQTVVRINLVTFRGGYVIARKAGQQRVIESARAKRGVEETDQSLSQ